MEGSCSQSLHLLLRFLLVLYLVSLQMTPLHGVRVNVLRTKRNPQAEEVKVTEEEGTRAKPVDPDTFTKTPAGTRHKWYLERAHPFWRNDFVSNYPILRDPTEKLTPYTGVDFNLGQIQIPDRPPDKEEVDRNMVLYTYYDDAFVDPKDLVYVIEPKLIPQQPEQIIEETFDLEREHFVLEDFKFGEPDFDLETVYLDQAPILINVTKEEKPADVKLYADTEDQEMKVLEADVETPEQNIQFEEITAPGRPDEHYQINFHSRPNRTLFEQEEIIRDGPPVEVESVHYKQPQFDVTKIVRKEDKPLHHRVIAKVYRNPDILVNKRIVQHPEKVVYFRNMKYPLVRYIVRYNLLSPAIVKHKISTIRYVKKVHGQPRSFEGFRETIIPGETGEEEEGYSRMRSMKTTEVVPEETEIPRMPKAKIGGDGLEEEEEESVEKKVEEKGKEAAYAESNDAVELREDKVTFRSHESEVKGPGVTLIDHYPTGKVLRTSSHPVIYRTRIQPLSDDDSSRRVKLRTYPVNYSEFPKSEPVVTYVKEHYLDAKRRYANEKENASVDVSTPESPEEGLFEVF